MRFPLVSPDANMWARKALPVTASSAAWWVSTIAVDSYAGEVGYLRVAIGVGNDVHGTPLARPRLMGSFG
jgi:hypothetical protein